MLLPQNVLDKIWVIEIDGSDDENNPCTTIVGGICVSRQGLILTPALHMLRNKLRLRGRCYSSRDWLNLQISNQKSNFNLALLSVSEGNSEFPSFDLTGAFDVARNEPFFSVIHRGNTVFTTAFGTSCRTCTFPCNRNRNNFPSLDSEDTISNNGNRQQVLLESHFSSLSVSNIVDYSDDELGYDDLSDELDQVLELKMGDINEQNMDFLHPDIPIIQLHGLQCGIGSIGCPVFKESYFLIGLYLFDKGGFEYVIPRTFLSAYVSQALAPSQE